MAQSTTLYSHRYYFFLMFIVLKEIIVQNQNALLIFIVCAHWFFGIAGNFNWCLRNVRAYWILLIFCSMFDFFSSSELLFFLFSCLSFTCLFYLLLMNNDDKMHVHRWRFSNIKWHTSDAAALKTKVYW